MYVSFCHPLQDKKGGEGGVGIPKFTHRLFGIQFIYVFNISPVKDLDLKKRSYSINT